MSKKEIEEFKSIFNNLLTETALLRCKCDMLQNMVLSVYKSTLTDEQYKNIYSNFVNLYSDKTTEALKGLQGILYDNGSFLVKQQFEAFSEIRQMKQSDDFLEI